MSRIDDAFSSLAKRGEKGIIIYLTAGDPGPGVSLDYLKAAADGGADLIEIGVPFSDPTADGPTIQGAFRRSLAGGMSVGGAISLVADFRKSFDTPVVIFGYCNPFLMYGTRRLCRDAVSAGANGFLVVDLPLEEAGEMLPDVRSAGMDWIPLASPTSGMERIRRSALTGSGFLYLISVTGITGVRKSLPPEIARWTRQVKKECRLPVAVGFGISTPAMARAAARHADAAVVGSACVKVVERHGASRKGPPALRSFVRSLKTALK